MRASLTIGGIEVALATSGGTALESLVATRYAPFLGAIERPVCSLILEADRRDEAMASAAASVVERASETSFRVLQPGLFGCIELAGTGVIDLAPTPYCLDNALRLLFGLLAPMHDALVVRGTTTTNNGAHLFIGSFDASIPDIGGYHLLADGMVLLRRDAFGWAVTSTPFSAAGDRPNMPREARLTQVWSRLPTWTHEEGSSLYESARLSLVQHLSLPTKDPEIRRMALDLADALVTAVPFSNMTFAAAQGACGTADQLVP